MGFTISFTKDRLLAAIGCLGLGGIVFYQVLLRDLYSISSGFLYVSGILASFCVLNSIFSQGIHSLFRYKEFNLLFVFHLYMLFAGLFSPNVFSTFSYWMNYSLDYVIFLCVISLLNTKVNPQKILYFAAVSTVILILHMQFNPAVQYGALRLRSSETGNPNTLGLIIVMGIWALVYISKFSTCDFLLKIVLCVIALLVVVKTGSRKSLLSLAIIVFFYILNYLDNVKIKKKFIGFSLFLFGLFYFKTELFSIFQNSLILQRLLYYTTEYTTADAGASDLNRLDMMWLGLRAFAQNPLFGYGYQGYRLYYNIDYYSHSGYIEVLVCGGIIGFLIYWDVFISVIVRLLNTYKVIKKNMMLFNNNTQILFQIEMLIVLWLVLILLSTVLILMYDTLYQVYIALMIGCSYYLDREVKLLISGEMRQLE